MVHTVDVEFNSVPYDTGLRNVRALTSAVKCYWMYFVESHILIPHSWIKIPHFRLCEIKNITAKFYNQNYRSSPASSQNFYRNDWVVSENEQFKVGKCFYKNFAIFFYNFFGNIHHLFWGIFLLFLNKIKYIFLKSPYSDLVGDLTGFGWFLRKSFSEATEPFFKIPDVLKNLYFSL